MHFYPKIIGAFVSCIMAANKTQQIMGVHPATTFPHKWHLQFKSTSDFVTYRFARLYLFFSIRSSRESLFYYGSYFFFFFVSKAVLRSHHNDLLTEGIK